MLVIAGQNHVCFGVVTSCTTIKHAQTNARTNILQHSGHHSVPCVPRFLEPEHVIVGVTDVADVVDESKVVVERALLKKTRNYFKIRSSIHCGTHLHARNCFGAVVNAHVTDDAERKVFHDWIARSEREFAREVVVGAAANVVRLCERQIRKLHAKVSEHTRA